MTFAPPGCSVCNRPVADHSAKEDAACKLRFREIVAHMERERVARELARDEERFFREVVIPHRQAEVAKEIEAVLPEGYTVTWE